MAKVYNAGEEIKNELRAKGKSARWLAKEINLTPQAVYDIFKRKHISTDRLIGIQRVLGRDFFKELSQHANNGGVLTNEEDENVIRERFALLMPEDMLHVLDHQAFCELAKEFVNTEHHKPLVIFHKHWDLNQPDIIKVIADRDLRTGQVCNVYLPQSRKNGESDDDIIQEAKCLPQPILEVTCVNSDKDFLFLKKLAEVSGKKVYAYCRAENKLVNDYHGQVVYMDRAVDSFGSWCEQMHFVFVDDERQSYKCNRWLYLASNQFNSFDVLSFLKSVCQELPGQKPLVEGSEIQEWLNHPDLLMAEYREFIKKIAAKYPALKHFRLMHFDDDEVSIKKDNETRWTLSLPACENYQLFLEDDWVKEQLKKRSISTSMWIRIQNNRIIDFEGSLMQSYLGYDAGEA